MGQPRVTITIRSPTQRRASRSASGACRIRATDLDEGRRGARIKKGREKAKVPRRDYSQYRPSWRRVHIPCPSHAHALVTPLLDSRIVH